MAGYVKMWTTATDDRAFLSLTLGERGAWFQVIMDAKKQRDDGTVFYRNMTAIGLSWGCDGRTVNKIVAKLQQNCNWKFTEHPDKTIEINIRNYKWSQEITAKDMNDHYRKNGAKMRPTRQDKTKQNKTIPFHKETREYFCEKYKEKLGVPYKFNGSVDGERIRRLLQTYGFETSKRIIDQLFVTEDEWIRRAELSIGILELKANKLAQELSKKDRVVRATAPKKPIEPEMTPEEIRWGKLIGSLAVRAVGSGKSVGWTEIVSVAEGKFSADFIEQRHKHWMETSGK
jgi:hypothetical protein